MKTNNISFGKVLFNMTISGGLGVAFAGFGYGLAKGFTALKLKLFKPSVIEGGVDVVSKPNQLHHFATNKNKTYTPQLKEVANKYDLKLNDSWNKEMLPHQGRHPNEYHEYVLNSMKQFDEIAQGNKDVFLKLYDGLKKNISSNPEMLYKNYWK